MITGNARPTIGVSLKIPRLRRLAIWSNTAAVMAAAGRSTRTRSNAIPMTVCLSIVSNLVSHRKTIEKPGDYHKVIYSTFHVGGASA
jgi:hypothetical protein